MSFVLNFVLEGEWPEEEMVHFLSLPFPPLNFPNLQIGLEILNGTQSCIPIIYILLTIFLLSLFREPFLCKLFILIFVPLPAEVQVFSL